MGHYVEVGEELIYNMESLANNSYLIDIISHGYVCLDNLGTGGKFSPENLRKCRRAYYYENNDTYECFECIENTL